MARVQFLSTGEDPLPQKGDLAPRAVLAIRQEDMDDYLPGQRVDRIIHLTWDTWHYLIGKIHTTV